jgi:hypothetical protein
MKRLWLALAAALGVLAIGPSAVLADEPLRGVFFEEVTTETEVCGIPVTLRAASRNTFLAFPDGTIRQSFEGTATYTNSEGDWVREEARYHRNQTPVIDGSILTLTGTLTGIPTRLVSSDGNTAWFDRGRMAVTIVVDLDTGEIDADYSFFGQHPTQEGDLDYCVIVTGVLG